MRLVFDRALRVLEVVKIVQAVSPKLRHVLARPINTSTKLFGEIEKAESLCSVIASQKGVRSSQANIWPASWHSMVNIFSSRQSKKALPSKAHGLSQLKMARAIPNQA